MPVLLLLFTDSAALSMPTTEAPSTGTTTFAPKNTLLSKSAVSEGSQASQWLAFFNLAFFLLASTMDSTLDGEVYAGRFYI